MFGSGSLFVERFSFWKLILSKDFGFENTVRTKFLMESFAKICIVVYESFERKWIWKLDKGIAYWVLFYSFLFFQNDFSWRIKWQF